MKWDGLNGVGKFRWTLVPYDSWDNRIVGECFIFEVLDDRGNSHRIGAAEGLENAKRWAERMDKGRDPRWNRHGPAGDD